MVPRDDGRQEDVLPQVGRALGLVYLHVEYAMRTLKYAILFLSSLIYEYISLEYVRVPV